MADQWQATVRFVFDGTTKRRVFRAAEISSQTFAEVGDQGPEKRVLVECFDELGELVESFQCLGGIVHKVRVGGGG